MKWLRLTTKECDMLEFFLCKWVNQREIKPEDTFETFRLNRFTVEEIKSLQNKVQVAYWDKDSRD